MDLKEAIVLGRDALALRPLGHSGRSVSLNNISLYLSTRCKQFRVLVHLGRGQSFISTRRLSSIAMH